MLSFTIPTACQTYLANIKPEDIVTRMLAGTIPIELKVEKVENGIIHLYGGWTFNQQTGMEIDEDLGWDGLTYSGSFLVNPKE